MGAPCAIFSLCYLSPGFAYLDQLYCIFYNTFYGPFLARSSGFLGHLTLCQTVLFNNVVPFGIIDSGQYTYIYILLGPLKLDLFINSPRHHKHKATLTLSYPFASWPTILSSKTLGRSTPLETRPFTTQISKDMMRSGKSVQNGRHIRNLCTKGTGPTSHTPNRNPKDVSGITTHSSSVYSRSRILRNSG